MLAADARLQERVRADDALVAALVEEAVRLESPFRGHFRVTTRATELGGVHLPEGARLMLLWGAANRDAAAFPRPDTLDLDRPAAKAHTSFGRGIHFCVGAHLARLETTVALRALPAATDHIAPAPDSEPTYVPSTFVRRLAHLPLTLTPRTHPVTQGVSSIPRRAPRRPAPHPPFGLPRCARRPGEQSNRTTMRLLLRHADARHPPFGLLAALTPRSPTGD
ncbi:cytochrome P450 [Embleya sp. NPDC001921]